MGSYKQVSVLLVLTACSGLIGCGGSTPPRIQPEAPDSSAASDAMDLYDANHDGFLDVEELAAAPGLKAAFKDIESKHGGRISKQDIADRIKSWADSRAGRVPLRLRVTHNGSPLAGAHVVLVPEKFLGAAIKSGSGTTSATGAAIVSTPNSVSPKVSGVAPGFYRVEITKEGEAIPAQYNTATTLGAEACSEQTHGLNFDLNY
jgi:hypothetical protein